MSGSRWCLCAAVLASCLVFFSCGDDPSGPGEITPDSAWMAVERLRTAYNDRDFDLFRGCLDGEFEYNYFDPISSQWLVWGLEYEELCHDSMFHTLGVDSVYLEFSGDAEWQWPGGAPDSSIRELTRDFDLYVYVDPSCGFYATGSVVFVCRPDSTGMYRIWQWTDYSDFGATDEAIMWPDVKRAFL